MPEQEIKKDLWEVEVPYQLAAYLGELNERARAEKNRDKESSDPKSKGRWTRFWTWWHDYHTGFSALVTTLSLLAGGVWAIAQFRAEAREKREQETKQLQLQRNGIIAQYATQLGDTSLRNSAVYALAALVREDALPLFILQLKDSARKSGQKQLASPGRPMPDDSAEADFRQALTQAVLLIGEPAFQPILQLNREVNSEVTSATSHGESDLLINASQAVLVRLLPGELMIKRERGHRLEFSGVFLRDIQLNNLDLQNANLSGTRFIKVSLQGANMTSSLLNGSLWKDVYLLNANLEDAHAEGTDLSEVALNCAKMDNVHADHAAFHTLPGVSLIGAQLQYASFIGANIAAANLERSDLHGANLTGAELSYASLRHANLSEAQLYRADLENADLSNADLRSAKLFEAPDDRPALSQNSSEQSPLWSVGKGAFVRGALFTGAQNVSDLQRRYLCRWGGVGVPGGCRDIRSEPIPARHSKGKGFSGGGGFTCGGGGGSSF